VSNMVNVLNPELVILEGFLASLLSRFEKNLLDAVKLTALNAATENLLIRTGALGSNAIMIRAADLMFARLIENPAAIKLFSPQLHDGHKLALTH
jgi:predicted NBD/HSP70 family sugar kinase